MKKDEKAVIISEVAEKIKNSSCMIFTDFSGLTVEQTNELRKEFRNAKIDYKVSKNTLIKRALKDMENSDKVVEYLKGPTGIVFGYDDPIEPIRIVKKFIDKHQKPAVKVVYFEKLVYPGKNLEELSKLPGKKDIFASIVGSIQSPLAGVPSVINSVIGGLASVIEAVAKKKEEIQN